MYANLKRLKQLRGLDAARDRTEKAWTWGLITDEQFRELMELDEAVETDVE